MEELLINMGVAVLLAAIKNPEKAQKLRRILLKVFTAIRAAFPGDPDFE